jgi:hypothetical protein
VQPELSAPAGSSGFLYAVGRIEPKFPNLSVEKEFAQATARAETAGLSDRETLRKILSEPVNRYLARQLCWTLSIEGIDTYVLSPVDSDDVDTLIETLRPTPRTTDLDVIVGTVGPLAPGGLCAGLQLPMVRWAQVYSFDVDSFLASLPKPEGADERQFMASAEDTLAQFLQVAKNAGLADHHRALNYLAVRYPAVYAAVAERHAAEHTLASIETKDSRLSGARRIVDVILSFRDRKTDVLDKLFASVDVTELFPFLVTKLSPYFDR